jgi:hypothetical protein
MKVKLRFSQVFVFWDVILCSWWKGTNIPDKPAAFIFRVEASSSLKMKLHGITSMKTMNTVYSVV